MLKEPWLSRIVFLVIGFGLKFILDTDFSTPSATKSRKKGAAVPTDEELKMVLVVNAGLGMGRGKSCAQCAHAAVALVDRERTRHASLLRQWENRGSAKICLKATDDQELRTLGQAAGAAGIPFFIVQDAGRTQVAAGSRTVLALGPWPKSQLDKITGHLKLL